MLAGIVVNNAIVLVDYINQLRRRGLDKFTAIMQAGQARLPPDFNDQLNHCFGFASHGAWIGRWCRNQNANGDYRNSRAYFCDSINPGYYSHRLFNF